MKQVLAFLKGIVKRIPGFRQLSSSSMVIAATWYGVALLTMAKYWYWGLALLALPFLVFYLIDRNVMKNKKLSRVIAIVAGCMVLLGAGCGLTSGIASAPGSSPAPPVTASATAGISAITGPSMAATLPATEGPSPARSVPATASAEAATVRPGVLVEQTLLPAGPYAYVASKNSDIFHTPDCSSAKRIKPENLVGFATREEAVSAGLRPCKRCKP